MTAKLAVGGSPETGEIIRRPASAAQILGRPFGSKIEASEVPPGLIAQQKANEARARQHLQSAVLVFGSVDGARERTIDPELSRSRV